MSTFDVTYSILGGVYLFIPAIKVNFPPPVNQFKYPRKSHNSTGNDAKTFLGKHVYLVRNIGDFLESLTIER